MVVSTLKFKIKTIGFVGAVVFLASSMVFAFTPYIPGNGEYPEFDLPPLTKAERWEKISKFIKPYEFEVYMGTAIQLNLTEAEQKDCEQRLAAVKSVTENDILEPEFVSQSVDDSQIKKLLQQCSSDFEPYKQYHPSKEAWNDKSHAHHSHTHYYLAASNMEFYDFSSLVGEGHWGLSSEGGRPHCKDPNNDLCTSMSGYSGFAKIFDAKGCQEYVLDVVAGRKISHGQNVNGKRVINHYKTNSFFAFFKDEEAGYVLSYQTSNAPEGACSHFKDKCSNYPEDAFMRVARIPKTKDFDKPFLQCTYRLKPSNQGE